MRANTACASPNSESTTARSGSPARVATAWCGRSSPRRVRRRGRPRRGRGELAVTSRHLVGRHEEGVGKGQTVPDHRPDPVPDRDRVPPDRREDLPLVDEAEADQGPDPVVERADAVEGDLAVVAPALPDGVPPVRPAGRVDQPEWRLHELAALPG